MLSKFPSESNVEEKQSKYGIRENKQSLMFSKFKISTYHGQVFSKYWGEPVASGSGSLTR